MITKGTVSAYRGFRRQAAGAVESHRIDMAVLPNGSPGADAHRLALRNVTARKRWEKEEGT